VGRKEGFVQGLGFVDHPASEFCLQGREWAVVVFVWYLVLCVFFMFCTMEVGIMEAAVAVGTFIRIEANKSCHSRSLLLRHHHHQVLGCNSKPGALHCKLKMGFSQNGCLSSLRVVVPPATAATGFKPLLSLKLVANLSRMGKVNASKVNGTKVEIGKKSSLDREEEEHGSKSMFSSLPPAVAADLESYVQNPAMQAVLVAMANVALLAVEKKQQQQITTIAAGKTEVPVDALRQGRLVEARLVYRQTFVIRSYEVGADKTASIETLMNHFQVWFGFVLFCLWLANWQTLKFVRPSPCTRQYMVGNSSLGFSNSAEIMNFFLHVGLPICSLRLSSSSSSSSSSSLVCRRRFEGDLLE
jgi:hypothetical protein